MNEKITIIIPSAGINFDKTLKLCVESLPTHTDLQSSNVKVLMVMNGMADKKKFEDFYNSLNQPNIQYLWRDEPLGYIGAINTGLDFILQQKQDKPDYVCFLNDDVVIHDKSWLGLLVKPFQSDELMGLVGAKSLPCPITGVDFPLGWCVLIKTEVFEKVGTLDPIFGIGYGDDTDICIKAIKVGYHVYSYVNGWDRKLNKSTGNFPLSHVGEGSMHSGVFFSVEDWNKQTAKNRFLLAQRYWENVHVIVPVYKRYNKLQKTLDSLRKQYYTNILVHVVSDGEDSKIRELVLKTKEEWNKTPYAPQIEYGFIEPHEGLYGSKPRISILNSLEASDREWVCFVDSDNLVNPDYILKLWQATFLQDVGGAWCKVRHLEERKDLPEPEFQKQPVWGQVDSLNYLVRLDIAIKHAGEWQHDPNRGMENPSIREKLGGPVAPGLVVHDWAFAIACFQEKKWNFVNEVLGSHGQPISILVQAVCYNEEKIIPFWLRHYGELADKIIVYDGGSTDKSLELLKASPKVEIISVPAGEMSNRSLMQIRNEAWKEYREDYDWVVVADMDEFLYAPSLKEKLEEFRRMRVTLPIVHGYQMISESFPYYANEQIYDVVQEGFADPEHLNKFMIFNPKCVDINYSMGCHSASPVGTVVHSPEPLYLLHYKYLGYLEFIERNKKAAMRLSQDDKNNHWAFHYALDAQMTLEEFRELKKKVNFTVGKPKANIPLAERKDLKQQNESVFHEVIESNQYHVTRQDFVGRNVIDVGANNGMFSLLARQHGAEKIIAVEPQPATLELLNRNTKGLNISVVEKAIGIKDGEHVEMVMRPEFCATDGRLYSEPAETGIETVCLDSLVKMVDDGKPILLKVDAEGAEYDLFYGASLQTLEKIHTVVMEAHEDIFRFEGKKGLIDKLRNYLAAVGFEEKFQENYVGNKVRLLRYEKVKKIEDDITVVISAFNRPELLKEQVEAVRKQTLQPKEIIVWLTKSKHWEEGEWKYADGETVKGAGWVETHFDIPEGVTLVKTENDLNLPARFAATLFSKTSYVLLLDDDIFPAEGYLEETLKVSKRENAVVCAYGMLYKNELNDRTAVRYGDHGVKNEEAEEVDVGGHSWFGRKEWFTSFFQEPVLSPTEGDDLHFAYTLKKYTNAKLFVSAVPENNRRVWANTKPDAGLGFRALHARKWEDVKKWTDPTKTSWGVEDKSYLEKNLHEFQARRQETLNKYRDEKKWVPLQNKEVVSEKKKIEVTVGIPTKNRYFSTLPLTLVSVMMQTYPIKKIILVDDSEPDKDGKTVDLRQETMYQYFFNMISKKGIEWEVVFGAKKGQHHSHQIIMDKAQTEAVWRVDDDEVPEANVLEELVKEMKDGVGCVGGLVLDPKMSQLAPPNYFNNNRLSDIDSRENTQWVKQKEGQVFEVEHLYSSFLYRKVEDIKYCLDLSPAAHREETLFSHEFVRKGWKVLVTTNCVTWHLRNPQGGIRAHANSNFWTEDDKIFKRKLASWSIPIEGKKLITLDSGIGDCICFLTILPELLKKYNKLVIGTYYPSLFKDFPVETIHCWSAKDILGEKIADLQNVYRKLWKESDAGRKLNLIQAYEELFVQDKP